MIFGAVAIAVLLVVAIIYANLNAGLLIRTMTDELNAHREEKGEGKIRLVTSLDTHLLLQRYKSTFPKSEILSKYNRLMLIAVLSVILGLGAIIVFWWRS